MSYMPQIVLDIIGKLLPVLQPFLCFAFDARLDTKRDSKKIMRKIDELLIVKKNYV